MDEWLWIVAAVAVIWPLIVAGFIFRALDDYINKLDFNAHLRLNELESTKINRTEIEEKNSRLQLVVNEQDKLIATIWANTIGYEEFKWSENISYVDSHTSRLREHWGVRPRWRVNSMSDFHLERERR